MPLLWVGIVNQNGIPLHTQTIGLPPPGYSFQHMALVSALAQSATEYKYHPTSLTSDDCRIACKPFGKLVLFVASNDRDVQSRWFEFTLSRMYSCIVLLTGEKVLRKGKPHIVAKKLKATSKLLDLFMTESEDLMLQLGTGIPEMIIPATPHINARLEILGKSIKARCIALYCRHRMVTGSKLWMKMDSRDHFTLSLLLFSLEPAASRDIAVYLRHQKTGENNNNNNSNNNSSGGSTPLRLMTVRVTADLQVVMLCGEFPKLTDTLSLLPRAASKNFQYDLQMIQNHTRRHVPQSIAFHTGIAGIMVHFAYFDQESGVALHNLVTCFGTTSHQMLPDEVTLLTRKRKLLTFYYASFNQLQAMSQTVVKPTTNKQKSRANAAPDSSSTDKKKESKAQAPLTVKTETVDSYMRSAENGYYACRRGFSTVFILFEPGVPFSSYRPIAEATTAALVPYVEYLFEGTPVTDETA